MRPIYLLLVLALAANAQFVPTIFNKGAGGGTVPTVRQTCSNSQATGSTNTVTCGSNFVAGDAIIIAIMNGSAGGALTYTAAACTGDSPSQDPNSPQTQINAGAYDGEVALFFVQSTVGGCASVVVTNSVSASNVVTVIDMSSGSAGLDTSVGATGATTNADAGSITTTNANDLIVTFFSSANNPTITVPAGYTSVYNGTNGNGSGAIAYLIVSSTGSYNPAFTTSLGNWAAITAAYKG